MSEFSNGTASSVSRAAGAALRGAGEIKDQVGEAAGRARSRFDSARKPVADKLHGAADRLEASADYIESRDARRMAQDLVGMIKRHPARSLLIAGVIGYLVARAFRSKD